MSGKFKVVIAYDGSAHADAALDDLTNAGLAGKEVEALVISVAEIWLPLDGTKAGAPVSPGIQKQHDESAEVFAETWETVRRAAGGIRSRFPAWQVTAHATYGSPAWEILLKANEFKPDLIVVGAQGVSGIDRILVGSVAQKILTEADCTVRIARGKIEIDAAPSRIILAYDGSEGADETVKALMARKWRDGTEVKVVIVRDSAHMRSTLDIEEAHVTEAGEELVETLKAAGIPASCLVTEGNPKKAIVEEAKAWKADCIFTGATGYTGRLAKYVIGSVSSAVASRAHCSVEVVRPNGYRG